MTKQAPILNLRPYQRRARAMKDGIAALVARRQSGKSYLLASIGLEWMMQLIDGKPADVLFMSAALRLGMENIRKEAIVWREVTNKLREISKKQGYKLTTSADEDNGSLLDVDAIADMFEHQKLETKLWHNTVDHSRSVVMAPNPDTAVGWTGHTIMDEVGRIPDFRGCYEGTEAFVSSNKGYMMRMATTPPPDDTHPSYEMLAPQTDEEFKPDAKGNFYETAAGIRVLRVDAWDCQACGIPLYDLRTREPVTPEQHRLKAFDKTAWDRNYACAFIKGGTAAISMTDLDHACAQGAEECIGIDITEQLALAS